MHSPAAMSRGSTASEGGEIGWINSGALAPRIEEQLLETEVGAYTEPLRANSGYYIYHVRNRRTPGELEALGDQLSFRAVMWKYYVVSQ